MSYCLKCLEEYGSDYKKGFCSCGGLLNDTNIPYLTGTRDNFGIRKEFYDVKTGKTIDNFKTWEKAGFKEPGSVSKTQGKYIKDKVKEFKKRKSYNTASKAVQLAERI